MEKIDTLEGKELTLADELYETYLALSDEEKAQISKFELLDTASKRVNFLSARKKLMPEIHTAAIEWVESCLQTPSTMEVLDIDVYPAYDSFWYGFARIHFTAENGYGGKVEKVYFVKLEKVGPSTFDPVQRYKGDAHATWEEVDWPDSVLEEIDFENRFDPNRR